MNEFLPETIELGFPEDSHTAVRYGKKPLSDPKPVDGSRMGLVVLPEPLRGNTSSPPIDKLALSKEPASASAEPQSIFNMDEYTGVTGVTGATASEFKVSNANPIVTPHDFGVTGMAIGNRIDQNQFPDPVSRPCYRVYETDCRPNLSYPPGVYYHCFGKSALKEPPVLHNVRLCGVLHVTAIARNKQGREFGLILEFRDKLGQPKRWKMPSRLLGGRGDELQKELFDNGLDIYYLQRSKLADYISRQSPAKTVWTTSVCGWFDQVFVLPHRVVGTAAEAVWFQADSAPDSISNGYRASGSLLEWQHQVARFCLGNPLLLLNVSQAFSGALLGKCQLDCVAVHVFGGSSQGKTSGMLLAGSVWGEPKRYNRSWTATLNGLESAALSVNDGLLCLDEMSKADAADVSKSLYMLANGMGKQRSTISGKAKALHIWRVSILSNGEESIEAHLQKTGLSAKAGELVRFLQLPVFGLYGAFSELHGMKSGREFSALLARNAAHVHGSAGLAFLEKLTRDERDFSDYLDRCLAIFEKLHGPLSPQEGRAARGFALIGLAGELASEYGVTGWPERAAMEAALVCFGEWRKHRGPGELEPKKLIESVRQYIELYSDSRFTKTDDNSRLHGERSGYWRMTDQGCKQWLFSSAGLKKAIGNTDFQPAVKLLIKEGVLKRGPKKYVTLVKILGVPDWFYVIQFQDDEHAG